MFDERLEMDSPGTLAGLVKKGNIQHTHEDEQTKARKSPLIDTITPKVFVPVGKYHCFIGKDRDKTMELLVEEKLVAGTSRAFVFSRELLTAMRSNTNGKNNSGYQRHMLLIESLVRYANFELFVINTASSGIISMNMLPLSFKYENGTNGAVGNILIPLEEAVPIPEDAVSMVNQVITNMNVVLSQIVPGLTIRIETLGEMVFANGKKGVKIQLMSLKNKKAIPLKYESEGIKKIILILQLLIVVYNQLSIAVAINELDAGYLNIC